MTHKITKTDNYLFVVDDSDIRKDDWYLRYNQFHMKCTELKTSFNEVLKKEEIIIKSEVCGDPYERSKDFIKKIIAHLPLNNSPVLEGIDLLPPLEDDVEKLAEEFKSSYKKVGVTDYEVSSFIVGYNKAKETFYTEEQLKTTIHKAIIFSEENRKITTGEYAGKFYKFYEELIQSLQQPKIPVAFECEMEINTNGKNGLDKSRMIQKTTINSLGFTQWVGSYIFKTKNQN